MGDSTDFGGRPDRAGASRRKRCSRQDEAADGTCTLPIYDEVLNHSQTT